MNEARARFAECYRIVEKGLTGEPFTHDGRFWKIERPIRLRPEPVDEEGPLLRRHRQPGQRRGDGRSRRGADLPLDLSRQAAGQDPGALAGARGRRGARRDPADLGQDVHRRHRRGGARARPPLLPALLRPAVRRTTSPTPTRGPTSRSTRTSAACSPTCASSPTRPSSARSWTPTWSAVPRRSAGASTSSPALGFNYFMVSSATPGTPLDLRQRMMTRFAEEVCPRYSRAMRQKRAA